MKKFASIFFSVMCMAAYAKAAESTPEPRNEEAKVCWFSQDKDRDQDDREVKCKAILVEPDKMAGNEARSTERVYLNVECTNRFRLEDRYAVQFDKGSDEYNVGTYDDKLALLIIEDEARTRSDRKQDATLIISKDRGSYCDYNCKTLRLKGKCEQKNDN